MQPLPISAIVLCHLLSVAPQEERGEKPKAEPIDAATLALFDYDREADIDIQESSLSEFEGYTVADITYASPAGGRIPAQLYSPAGDGPYAGILLMHGMPGSHRDMAAFAPLYAMTGAVVLTISAPWARPDGPRPRILTFTEKDRAEQIQLIQDLRRGVDLLESLPWVDDQRIAYVGGSYGGAMGGLLAGVEHRIKAFVLMVGDGGVVAHSTGPDDEDGPPGGISEEQWQRWLEAMRPIEPISYVGHAAPSRLLFQNAREDQFVPAATARTYQEAGSEPKTVLWYDGGHGLSPQLLRDNVVWLAALIGIDPMGFGEY